MGGKRPREHDAPKRRRRVWPYWVIAAITGASAALSLADGKIRVGVSVAMVTIGCALLGSRPLERKQGRDVGSGVSDRRWSRARARARVLALVNAIERGAR